MYLVVCSCAFHHWRVAWREVRAACLMAGKRCTLAHGTKRRRLNLHRARARERGGKRPALWGAAGRRHALGQRWLLWVWHYVLEPCVAPPRKSVVNINTVERLCVLELSLLQSFPRRSASSMSSGTPGALVWEDKLLLAGNTS